MFVVLKTAFEETQKSQNRHWKTQLWVLKAKSPETSVKSSSSGERVAESTMRRTVGDDWDGVETQRICKIIIYACIYEGLNYTIFSRFDSWYEWKTNVYDHTALLCEMITGERIETVSGESFEDVARVTIMEYGGLSVSRQQRVYNTYNIKYFCPVPFWSFQVLFSIFFCWKYD